MKIKLFIFNLLISFSFFANALPRDINLIYDLKFEQQPLGLIEINYKRTKDNYLISASSDFKGPLLLMGNYQIIKNKIISSQIDYKNNLIKIKSKNKVKEYKLENNTQDILSYFFELNALKNLPKQIDFNILDSHDYKKYRYVMQGHEKIMINDRLIEVVKYEGRVNDEALTHTLWVSQKNHIPIRLITPTPIGLIIDQVLTKGNILNLI
ncbi:MAG: hypothetical protein RIQ77_394 [Pseudomonadota bacterium]